MKIWPPLLTAALLATSVSSCGVQSPVDHPGEYTFLRDADVPDTTVYPLRSLLIVEEDTISEKTLVYFFHGDLAAAGIGIEALERIAHRYGRYAVVFRLPKSLLREGLAGIEDAAATPLYIDDELITNLVELNQDYLFPTGANVYLRNLDGQALTVWFGAFDQLLNLQTMSFTHEDIEYVFEPDLSSNAFDFRKYTDQFTLSYPYTPTADYLVADLFQDVTRIADEVPVETCVETSFATGGEYFATFPLIQDAFNKSCWSLDKPLYLRVTQIARSYIEDSAGDLGIIHRRSDVTEVSASDWKAEIVAPALPSYCAAYQ